MILLFATNNAHKLHEAREKLRFFKSDIVLKGLSEVGFSGELPETGNTLHANALQKAQTLYEKLSQDCFADDTGLEIEVLNGAPGVYSARYAEMFDEKIMCRGDARPLSEVEMRVAPTFDENMNLVLSQLHGKTNRRACFRTVIALILKGEIHYFEGRVNGEITTEKHGIAGFGYDPIFRPDGYEKTFAELPLDVKNRISHRGRAIEEMANWVRGTNKQINKSTNKSTS